MNRTRQIRSSSGTFSIRRTISREVRYSSTSAERQAEKADFPTCRLGVSINICQTSILGAKIRAVIQILMEKFNGLGVILENRYYGESYPYNSSTTDELRFLTTEQSK
jgi:hypothetical protein